MAGMCRHCRSAQHDLHDLPPSRRLRRDELSVVPSAAGRGLLASNVSRFDYCLGIRLYGHSHRRRVRQGNLGARLGRKDTVPGGNSGLRADPTRPVVDRRARTQVHHMDGAISGASGAAGDAQRLPPIRRRGLVALEAREDKISVVRGRQHICESLIGVCHRLPELRLLCVAFETPMCLPFPAWLFALASFGFVLPEALLPP